MERDEGVIFSRGPENFCFCLRQKLNETQAA